MWVLDSGRGGTYSHLHWLTKIAIQPLPDPFRRIPVDTPRGHGQTIRREWFIWTSGDVIGSLIGHQGPFLKLGAPVWFRMAVFQSNRCVEDCENASISWDACMEGDGLCPL